MLFVIDIGNTNIVSGIYDGETLTAQFRMATEKNRSSDELGLFFMQMLQMEGVDISAIHDVIISSVVPPMMHAIENAVKKYIKKTPIIVSSSMELGMNIQIDNPGELGADRYVNAIAAYRLYGGPALIIDFGTATTICAVDAAGDYRGGIIYPGLKISVDALVEKTAKLPRIEIVRPDRVIGNGTVHGMQSGIVYGYTGAVDGLVRRMSAELGGEVKVIATGGLSGLIASVSETIQQIDRDLTLKGLKIIYDRLKGNPSCKPIS